MNATRLALRGAAVAGAVGVAAVIGGLVAGAAGAESDTAVLIVIAAALAGGVCGLFAFVGPDGSVGAVSEAANRLAAGELGQRVTRTSASTVELTRNFNAMADQVQMLFATMGAEHARLEAVLEASADGMIAVSRDSTVRFLNPAALTILGVDRQSAIDAPLIESARDYELVGLVRRVIAGGAASQDEMVITFGPRRIPLRAVAMPIVAGGDWAVLLMLNDLTEVQRVDQVRRDFLTNVSHELRTPLASIRAMVETLEDEARPGEDSTEFLIRIRQQVDRLTTLVNELLDLSRLESGAVELRPEPIDVAELCVEAADLMGTRAAAEGVQIAFPSRPGPVIEGDRTSLLRVMSNLVDNAIKFSPRDATIHTEVRDEGDIVSVSVRDEGDGIAAADLPRVFERFYKGDTSRSEAGVGLGLAIVKHTVRVHGGTVEASSAPGCGATFTVRLPKKFVGRTPHVAAHA